MIKLTDEQANEIGEALDALMESERVAGRCEHVNHFAIHVDENEEEAKKVYTRIRELLRLPEKRYEDLGWVWMKEQPSIGTKVRVVGGLIGRIMEIDRNDYLIWFSDKEDCDWYDEYSIIEEVSD